jgi:hypothetical protein
MAAITSRNGADRKGVGGVRGAKAEEVQESVRELKRGEPTCKRLANTWWSHCFNKGLGRGQSGQQVR